MRHNHLRQYNKNGILISTAYDSSKQCFNTLACIKNDIKTVEQYSSILEAEAGHEKWVRILTSHLTDDVVKNNKNKKEVDGYFSRITLAALIRILYKITDVNNPLRFARKTDSNSKFYLSIVNGENKGYLLYNNDNKTVDLVSAGWLDILNKTHNKSTQINKSVVLTI